MEFEYRIEKERVILLRCYGEEERVELPETLEGYPVTDLAPYIFSQSRREPDRAKAICGNQVKELRLPSTLRTIGNYAFYGCFSLEKLSFYHKINGIGGGVFTGCHRLKELDVYMEEAEGYSLKNILGELHHELRIRMYFENAEICELLMPEFYEEAVENTPARNVDMAFHGSGYSYRQCFRDGVLQFDEYDRALVTADHLESEDFCVELCLLRLKYPHDLSVTAKGTYISWLMEHRIAAATWCIEFEQNESLELITEFIDWREEELNTLIEEANRKKRMEIQSFLMDYKNLHFRKKKKTFEL